MTPRSVGTLLLAALIIYVVVTMLAGVDLASVAAALRSADWVWLVAALLLSPVIQSRSPARPSAPPSPGCVTSRS